MVFPVPRDDLKLALELEDRKRHNPGYHFERFDRRDAPYAAEGVIDALHNDEPLSFARQGNRFNQPPAGIFRERGVKGSVK